MRWVCLRGRVWVRKWEWISDGSRVQNKKWIKEKEDIQNKREKEILAPE